MSGPLKFTTSTGYTDGLARLTESRLELINEQQDIHDYSTLALPAGKHVALPMPMMFDLWLHETDEITDAEKQVIFNSSVRRAMSNKPPERNLPSISYRLIVGLTLEFGDAVWQDYIDSSDGARPRVSDSSIVINEKLFSDRTYSTEPLDLFTLTAKLLPHENAVLYNNLAHSSLDFIGPLAFLLSRWRGTFDIILDGDNFGFLNDPVQMHRVGDESWLAFYFAYQELSPEGGGFIPWVSEIIDSGITFDDVSAGFNYGIYKVSALTAMAQHDIDPEMLFSLA